MEKRIALADHRLLTYMAQFLACSWQLAYDKNDEFAMGLMSRGLMMVEQICLDQGRCQFGWLLSGLPDPDLQQIAQNRKRVSLKPYARLAAAPWVAANIAFLKDLDYLESRLRAGKPADRPSEVDKGAAEDGAPKKHWKPKRKAKGGNKDAEADQAG